MKLSSRQRRIRRAALPFALAFASPAVANETASLRHQVERHASSQGVPGKVAHAVVTIESRYNPGVAHRGNYGLMQIRYGTAKAMGYKGAPSGLLNADTNLTYGMKYLARAWKQSNGDLCRAIAQYQTGRPVKAVPRSSQAYCARAQKIMASR